CCLKAKDTMYLLNFPDGVGFNLFGDPELNIYTKTPKPLSVFYPNYIVPGNQNFTVSVFQEGNPVSNALVCIKKGDTIPFEIYKYGYTNSNGQITFSINPQNIGNIDITVTYKNSLPYEGVCEVIPGSGPYLTFDTLEIYDFPPLGNGDNKINPGETILFRVGIRNIGNSTAEQVYSQLRTNSSDVIILDSISSYGNIPANERRFNETNFKVYVTRNCQVPSISFSLSLSDRNNNAWLIQFSCNIYKGKISFLSYLIKDTLPYGNNNQRLDPGEAAFFLITLKNEGNANLRRVYCRLKTEDTILRLSDSLGSFGEILAGQTKNNNSDPLAFYLSPLILSGREVHLKIYVKGYDYTYEVSDSFLIVITCGEPSTTLPTGPDLYGYYFYDNTDISSGNAPNYNWIDIRTLGTQIPGVSEANDTTVTIPLPFRFKFYGNFYDSISVSSNGFLAMGRTTYRSGENLYLPNNQIPTNIIAPFWDDLTTIRRSQNDPIIYQYYDVNNHIFIIQFHNLYRPNAPNQREVFEVIFYDPNYYPTPTGDGEILFQYNTVSNALSNTIGIQNSLGEIGLTYLFNGSYHPNSASIISGRAIKITTKPPVGVSSPFITLENIYISDSLGNNNRIIEIGEPILLAITLKNSGNQQSNNLRAILQKRDDDCIINESLFNIGNLLPNERRDNNEAPYLFTVNQQPNDTILDFTLKIIGENYQKAIYFSLGIAPFSMINEEEFLNFKLSFPTLLKEKELKKIYGKDIKIYDYLGREIKEEKIRKGIYFIKKRGIRKIVVIK
ncbi:MAG: hypothetical protein N2323_07160, partial [candidate division WOR-3 bacterium]|nr:hypothetical protein [candidate division WOR-3 bacterium]MCX7837702.1 hypothetical protein [candidate division WOR-3 bacterium]MDW8114759.1 hypothetical protein [candidate division WOR-3 bacterium]